MPNMPDPFAAALPGKKLTRHDLIQALRTDIVGELEAIFLYDAHSQASDDPLVKAVLADIRDEEKAHIGELTALLHYLDPAEADHALAGQGEVAEMMEKLGITIERSGFTGDATIGSLKN